MKKNLNILIVVVFIIFLFNPNNIYGASQSQPKNLTLIPADAPRLPTPQPLSAPVTTPNTTEGVPEIDYKKEEHDARKIIDTASQSMVRTWLELRTTFVKSTEKYSQDKSGPTAQETLTKYRHFVNELATNLSIYHIHHFENEGLRRQIKYLSKLQLEGLPDEKYGKSMKALRALKNLVFAKKVCPFVEKCTDPLPYWPNITEAIERTQSEPKLKYYWKNWRDEISADAKKNIVDYIDLFRQAAIINGHYTPSKTWYLYYEENDNLLIEIEEALAQMMGLYKEFHGFMRNLLHNKFNSSQVDNHGPIPHHLMEQVIMHAWRAKALFKPPYPRKQLPNVKDKMDLLHFSPRRIVDVSEEFYTDMGFPRLQHEFWSKYLRLMSDEEPSDECKAETYYFHETAALKYCPTVDFKKFLQMHGNLAEIHYNYLRGNLPFGLDAEACPGFGDAIGEAAIIAAGSPNHLERKHLWENYALDNELATNRLFRMGVHTIFTIPQYFVNEKFWVDLLDNKIKANNMNCKYWEIQQKYAGVTAPEKRNNKQFDVGYKFYSGIDPKKATTKKLLSELLGYQFFRALCIKSGQYKPGDDQLPLHNCDFSANFISGKLIQDVMSLGSTQHWRDVMEMLTGERKITATGILEYYEPLYTWLKEENKRNNVQAGWNTDNACEDK